MNSGGRFFFICDAPYRCSNEVAFARVDGQKTPSRDDRNTLLFCWAHGDPDSDMPVDIWFEEVMISLAENALDDDSLDR